MTQDERMAELERRCAMLEADNERLHVWFNALRERFDAAELADKTPYANSSRGSWHIRGRDRWAT